MQVNLAYRWFCKLGSNAVPDHSAFSRARNERFREGDVFRRVLERVVEACIAAGLVGSEGFAVNASLIQGYVHTGWANKRHPLNVTAWQHSLHDAVAVNKNMRQGCGHMNADCDQQRPFRNLMPAIDLMDRVHVFCRQHRQRNEIEI